jgi:MscS family membrane protein
MEISIRIKKGAGMKRVWIFSLASLFLLSALLVRPGVAQLSKTLGLQSDVSEQKVSDDPLGRSAPYGTVKGFVKSTEFRDYAKAAQYLHTRKKGEAAQKLAEQLQTVLDWGLKVDLEKLSRKPEGDPTDGLEIKQDRIGTIDTSFGKLDILLDRVDRDGQSAIWLFSSETLALIPQAAEETNSHVLEKHIPQSLVQIKLLAIPLYRWILFICALALSIALGSAVTRALSPLLRRALRRLIGQEDTQALASIKAPVRVVLISGAILLFSNLSITLYMRQFWKNVGVTVAIVGLAWLAIKLIGILSTLHARHLLSRQMQGKIAMWALLSRLLKAAVAIVAALLLLRSAGANLTAILAGLGVGGIAVALGAQKTLENLFGGMMIISDEPIRVGDFCRLGDQLGTVEDIGLRSTRIRTLSRTVVAIPNGQLAIMNIENFSVREKFWFRHMIGLRYETSADQLRYVLAEVRRMFHEHSKVDPADARIRFVGLGSSSLDLEMFAYIKAAGMPEFLGIQEDLLLRIMDIVAKSGTGIAFPSQTTYVGRDERFDPQKTGEAEMQVRAWREKNKLRDHDFYVEPANQANDHKL